MSEVILPSQAKAVIQVKTVRIKTVLLVAALGLSTTGCSTITESLDAVTGVFDSGEPAPVSHQVGKPYVVKGVRYVPREDPDYNAVGTASWYGRPYHGRKTASGQIYNMNAPTAAHPTLPLGTLVRVTNLANHRSVVLTVNDRGPFAKGRIIDVSRHAAEHLGFRRAGSTRVRVEVIQAATIGGSAAGSQQAVALPAPPYLSGRLARIITPRNRLQCVPYARQISKVSIRGDAWTWWPSAKGRYGRGSKPKVGSVLVLKRARRLRDGHIAVVTHILSSREIIINHANWLNRGRLHLGTPVRDVSANNDWSAVRVWYTPGKKYGVRSYPAHGFIYPESPMAANSAQQGFLADPASWPTGHPPAGLDLGNS